MGPLDRNAALRVAALLLLCTSIAAQEADEKPIDLGIQEEVDVNFVLVDFMVLDGNDRQVADLTIEDFKLKIGGTKTPIANLDRACRPAGEAPRPGDESVTTALPSGADQSRIVLVFDYDHMLPTAEVFDRVLEMLDNHPTEQREHMIVSFTGVVRIETPFTTDADELRWALRRMRNDRDLFARHHEPVTGMQFFDRVRALLDLLERWPGRKKVVLFSGPFVDDGFVYDTQYQELAALSAAVRTALYPVDSFGLRAGGARLGGPDELRRLATETGGRMTADTNNIGLGYARAQQDLACVYTVGFYDPDLRFDRDRRLTLKIPGREGLRAVYPDFYVVRSEEEKQTSLIKTAGLAPQMFESDEIQARLFVTGAEGSAWKAVATARVRLDPGAVEEPDKPWDLRGFLRKPNGTVVQRFTRKLRLPGGGAGEPGLVDAFEEMVVPPGDYALSVVLSHSSGAPLAATRAVTLPALPRRGPFLIGPLPGRQSGSKFEPLIDARAGREESLDLLTVFCFVNDESPKPRSAASVTRRIADREGADVQRFDEASAELKGYGVRCREIIDPLGAGRLEPGEYEIHGSGAVADWVTESNVTELTILEAGHATSGASPE